MILHHKDSSTYFFVIQASAWEIVSHSTVVTLLLLFFSSWIEDNLENKSGDKILTLNRNPWLVIGEVGREFCVFSHFYLENKEMRRSVGVFSEV